MKETLLSLRALVCALIVTTVSAIAAQNQTQPAADPVYYQTLNYLRVETGKSTGFLQFTRDTSKKVAQARADAGEILSWTLLRSVYPAGQEARANYMISTVVAGPPRSPMGNEEFEKWLRKVGVNTPLSDWTAQRNSHSSLVSSEMWRMRTRVGTPKEGHYLQLNLMKVRDAAAQIELATTMWRPMAEEWVRQGVQSAWLFGTKVYPSGTETPYAAYTVDAFPTWEAVFTPRSAQAVHDKVHPGKTYQETMAAMSKVRDIARRELWVVLDRVEKR